MLKWLVIVGLVQAIWALPGMRTQEEIDEFRSFLYQTKQEREINLEEAMAENPEARAWEMSGKYQGDILLHDEEIEALVNDYAANVTDFPGRNGLVATARRWPNSQIIYEVAPGFFNAAQTNAIHAEADWFGRNSCVRWVRRTNQANFVRITGRPTGCYAHVGFWNNFGVHTLNLAPNGCMNRFIIIHEMLHSAGFNHMHQTYNRNDWIIVQMQNVQSGMEHNFNIFGSNTVTMLGLPYEYGSNQHYSATAFSRNGQPTIVARFNHNGQMGRLQVTNNDILRLRRLYNCPGAWSMQINEEDVNKPLDDDFIKRMDEAAQMEMAQEN